MKYYKLTLITFLFFSISFSGFSQRVKSTTAYTLATGEEVVFQLEHKLAITKKGTESRIFIKKKDGGTEVFYCLENGKKKGPYQEIQFSFDDETFGYKKAGKWYRQEYGKTYGPFSDLKHHYKKEVFYATVGGKMAIYIHGKKIRNVEMSKGDYPSQQVAKIAIAKNGNYAFAIKENAKWNVIVNGKIIKNVDVHSKYKSPLVRALTVSDKGKFAFVYSNGNNWKININGKDVQDLEAGKYYGTAKFRNLTFDDNTEKFSYRYSQEGKSYVNIRGKTFGPYMDKYTVLNFDKKGNYYLQYLLGKKKYYYDINGTINGPFEKINTTYGSFGDYYYTLQEGGSRVVIDGTTYGPYSKVFGLTVQNDFFHYKFEQDGELFVNLNGVIEGPYKKPSVYTDKKGKYLVKYKKNGGAYVFTDNKTFGPFKKIKRQGIENGKYYFAAEKDGKTHLIVNGVEKGRYASVGWETNSYYQKYKKNDTYYYNVNEKEIKVKYAQVLLSKDKKHSMLVSNLKNIFYIDGKKQKQTNIFSQNYNENKNSFSWFSLKGEKIMINEVKLK